VSTERYLNTTAKPAVETFGQCIYCRDVFTHGLGKGYVMPNWMGGGFIMLQACCEKYRVIIYDEFENLILNSMFGPLRQ